MLFERLKFTKDKVRDPGVISRGDADHLRLSAIAVFLFNHAAQRSSAVKAVNETDPVNASGSTFQGGVYFIFCFFGPQTVKIYLNNSG